MWNAKAVGLFVMKNVETLKIWKFYFVFCYGHEHMGMQSVACDALNEKYLSDFNIWHFSGRFCFWILAGRNWSLGRWHWDFLTTALFHFVFHTFFFFFAIVEDAIYELPIFLLTWLLLDVLLSCQPFRTRKQIKIFFLMLRVHGN